MTAPRDCHELHELIDRLDPEQIDELAQRARALSGAAPPRFRVLRTFDGSDTHVGARARDLIRTEIGDTDAALTQSGAALTAVHESCNGTAAPGGGVSFGFRGTWASNDSPPTAFTINGSTCS